MSNFVIGLIVGWGLGLVFCGILHRCGRKSKTATHGELKITKE